MLRKFLMSLCVFFNFLIASVSYAKLDFSKYQEVPLLKANHFQINQDINLVIMIEDQDKSLENIESSNIVYNILYRYLNKQSDFNILKRQNKENILDEIKLNELNLNEKASHAIKLDISKVKYKRNQIHLIAFVEIYDLQAQKSLLYEKITYKYSSFEPASIIMFDATETAVQKSIGPFIIANLNSLKKGKILKKMQYKNNSIYQISLNLENIAIKNPTLNFYSEPFNKIATARVKSYFHAGDNWILIKNKEIEENLKFGTILELTKTEAKSLINPLNSSKNLTFTAINIVIDTGKIIIKSISAVGKFFTTTTNTSINKPPTKHRQPTKHRKMRKHNRVRY